MASSTPREHDNDTENNADDVVDLQRFLDDAEDKLNQAQADFQDARRRLEEAEARFNAATVQHADAKERLLDGALRQPSPWNDMYRKLLQYKEEHGNCLVPMGRDSSEDEKKLGKWVQNQRVHYKYFMNGDRKHIKEHRIEALNRIGFVWNVKDHAWNMNFEELKKYHREHGNFDVPTKVNSKLAGFVSNLRTDVRRRENGIFTKTECKYFAFLWNFSVIII